MKKILHIVHQYAPDFVGGTELYTAKLAAKQAALGHDVAVFTPAPRRPEHTGGPLDIREEDGVTVCRVFIGERSPRQVFSDTFRSQVFVRRAFAEFLRRFKPDVVHIQHDRERKTLAFFRARTKGL